jgi:hypothetical protein
MTILVFVDHGRSRDLAALLGSKPSSVSDWLNGRTVLLLEYGLSMRIQQILARHRVRLIRNEGIE